MAHYTINHTCGHSVEIQLFGKMKDRYSRIEWLETQECEECKRAKANAAAAAAKEARGLADLEGSEKQVAWANTIRENAYKALECLIPFSTNEKTQAMMDGWKAMMDAKLEAKWWIDNRYDMPKPFDFSSYENIPAKKAGMEKMAAGTVVREFINLFK